jgi:hypothetical protein
LTVTRWPSLAFGLMSLIFHAFECGIPGHEALGHRVVLAGSVEWVRMEPFLHQSSKSLVVAARLGSHFRHIPTWPVCASYAPLSACRAWPTTCSRRLGPKVFARPSRTASAAEPPRKASSASTSVAMPASQSASRAMETSPQPSGAFLHTSESFPGPCSVRAEGPPQVQNRHLPPRPSPRLSAVYRSCSCDNAPPPTGSILSNLQASKAPNR